MLKFFGLFTLLSLSYSAIAQTCYVDMVNRYQQVVRSYNSYDANYGCKDSMKQCRLDIRLKPQLGGVDCIRDTGNRPTPNPYPTPAPNPYPNPAPYPNPNPNPNPYPQPDYGYPHNIIIGERVVNVNNGRYAEVLSQDYQGKYVLRYQDNGTIGTGWTRQSLAPMRGCDMDICVNERIFNPSNNRFATVIALQVGNKFVLRYEDNGFMGTGWTRSSLAVMKGCQAGLCVGQRVINLSNHRYASVIALQSSNRFVLKYEDNHAIGTGWTSSSLAPIR